MKIDELPPFHFTIKGQPATKKNSSRMIAGRARLLPSKAYTEYCSKFHRQLMDMDKVMEVPHFRGPVALTCYYWLRDRAHYPDLIGLEQATADIMSDTYKTVNHKRQLQREWILSDDRIIKSWDGSRIMGIDKMNPRVEIIVRPLDVQKDEPDPYILRLMEKSYRLF